ncbi:MAG: xanthine phosphoribosyltransferase [Lachnospiraceae bacterium]|nr:xanthine phosphoribosyltransferase [Lachnospiraceae bacterium]
MKLLEDRIKSDGIVIGTEILKVGAFLNQQMDVALFREMGREWRRLYDGETVTKILTVEASGIAIACMAAEAFGDCPVVFAKKTKTRNVAGSVYSASVYSFTHMVMNEVIVPKEYLQPGDRVLIIDDFLANGEALRGLISIVKESGAALVGCGIAIEKTFQPGGASLREEGIRIESLAKIRAMSEDTGIVFEN